MRAPAFWSRPRPGALARALSPLGALYGAATARRMAEPGARVRVPVLCVGNFVVGGAGKTPTAIALARLLQHQGRLVAFLSRGYGGARRVEPLLVDPNIHGAGDVGDEPLLLSHVAPCFVGPDRVASAEAAIEAGAELLILDDGLQNPALTKDFSFGVVDGEVGFGNGLVFPAGPLRAPLAAQAPAVGALIVVGGEGERIRAIGEAAAGKPLLTARLEPDAFAAAGLIGRPVLAFAGIARPEKFYATLRRLGAQVTETRDFPDHHAYRTGEVTAILARAAQRGLIPVTTEKDHVRLARADARRISVLPATLRFDRPETLATLLEATLKALGRA